MNKRILSLILCVAMMLCFAVPVSADPIDGEQKIWFNSLKKPYDQNWSYTDFAHGGTLVWDAETYTLTMSNFNQPYFALTFYEPLKPVTVRLVGDNVVERIDLYKSELWNGEYGPQDLTFTGDGTLDATQGPRHSGLRVGGVLTVDGPSIKVNGFESHGFVLKSGEVSSVYFYYHLREGVPFVIQDGTLTVDTRPNISADYAMFCYEAYPFDPDYSVVNADGEPLHWITNPKADLMYLLANENEKIATYVAFSNPNYVPEEQPDEPDAPTEPSDPTEPSAPNEPSKPTEPTTSFEDVVPGAFYVDAVNWAVENNITKGTDTTHFSPKQTCTRDQVVTFLYRAAGEPAVSLTENPFVDVSETAFCYKAVLWAVENNITTGMDATHFSPKAECSRGQVVTFLHRAQGKPTSTTDNPFVDANADSFYYDAMLWALANNITNGTDATHFSPQSTCTRGQVVTFLFRCEN